MKRLSKQKVRKNIKISFMQPSLILVCLLPVPSPVTPSTPAISVDELDSTSISGYFVPLFPQIYLDTGTFFYRKSKHEETKASQRMAFYGLGISTCASWSSEVEQPTSVISESWTAIPAYNSQEHFGEILQITRTRSIGVASSSESSRSPPFDSRERDLSRKLSSSRKRSSCVQFFFVLRLLWRSRNVRFAGITLACSSQSSRDTPSIRFRISQTQLIRNGLWPMDCRFS